MSEKRRFSKLIVENQNIIHKITYVYTQNLEDREDLFQEICIQLWKSHQNFKNNSKFSTWTYKVALNTAINYIKKREREIQPLLLDRDYPSYDGKDDNDENSEKLFYAISKLNRINKAIIILWLEEKSYDEIATILGMSKSNVSVKLVRIKKKLSEMINGKTIRL